MLVKRNCEGAVEHSEFAKFSELTSKKWIQGRFFPLKTNWSIERTRVLGID